MDPMDPMDQKEIFKILFKKVDDHSNDIIAMMDDIRQGKSTDIAKLSNGFYFVEELEFIPDVQGLWKVNDHCGPWGSNIVFKTDTWLAAALTVIVLTTKIGIQIDADDKKAKSDKKWHDNASRN